MPIHPPKNLRKYLPITGLLLAASAAAHPGFGIQRGVDGSIYFTDLGLGEEGAVCRLSPDGGVTVLAEEVHAHDLELAGDGSLYFLSNPYIEGKGVVSLVRLTGLKADDEKVSREVLDGPTEDYGLFGSSALALSEEGNVVVVADAPGDERITEVRTWTARGEVEPLAGGPRGDGPTDGMGAEARFGHITDIHIGPNGEVYISDSGSIRVLDKDGSVRTIATGLIEDKPETTPYGADADGRWNIVLGIDVADDGSVYAAYHGGCSVKKISPEGEISVVYESPTNWSTAGVCVVDDGVLVLESGTRRGNFVRPRIVHVPEGGEPVELYFVVD